MEVRNMNDDPASTTMVALDCSGGGCGLRRIHLFAGLPAAVVMGVDPEDPWF